MKEKILIDSLKPWMDVAGIDAGTEVERKRFSSRITISADEEKTCVAVISTTDEDAEGDVIFPSGGDLKRFEKNPVILYAHNYSGKPVAKAVALSVGEDGITAKLKFADTEEANDVWSLIKGGFLNANSIGFIAKEKLYKGSDEFKAFVKETKLKIKDTVNRIISKWELLESSIVPIPCNPEALMVAVSNKSITLSDKTIKELDLPKVVVIEKTADKSQVIAPQLVTTEVKEATAPAIAPLNEVIAPLQDAIAPIKSAIVLEDEDEDEEEEVQVPLQETVVEPSRSIKVIKSTPARSIKVERNGGIDIKKLIELKRKGKIV
jgi:HK97 family phage prohead protease